MQIQSASCDTMSSLEGLTEAELHAVASLKQEVADTVQAHPDLQVFCSDWTYVRYLRARQWSLSKATKMLRATLEWRLNYKPHLITWDTVEHQATTGKQMIMQTRDKGGRPVILMRSRFENSTDSENQVKFLIYHLERASHIADATAPDHKMAWLIDFVGYSLRTAPPVKVSLNCLNILQNHYPERLGLAVCFHAPSLFSITYKAVAPFIDPVTAKKIVFIEKNAAGQAKMESLFDMTQMEQCMGGAVNGILYNHGSYGAAMKEVDKAAAARIAAAAQQQQHPAAAGATATLGTADAGHKLATAAPPSMANGLRAAV